jgi:hypothetical protein
VNLLEAGLLARGKIKRRVEPGLGNLEQIHRRTRNRTACMLRPKKSGLLSNKLSDTCKKDTPETLRSVNAKTTIDDNDDDV